MNKLFTKTMTNAVDPANPVKPYGKNFGFRGVPGKFGRTTNAVIVKKVEEQLPLHVLIEKGWA